MRQMTIFYLSTAVLFVLILTNRIHKRRNQTGKTVLIDDANCARCKSCVNKCPHNVLEMVNNEKGTHIIIKNSNLCTGCGLCLNVCNFNAIRLVSKQ